LGAIMSLVEYRQMFGPSLRVFLTIGILGGFTTFSTFGFETFALLRDQEYAAAIGNVVGNVVIGMLAVVGGWMLAKSFS
jgi:CrcB protein